MAIYLDNAASTPLHPDVLEKMVRALSDSYGNPSSIHTPGRRARRLVEEARETVAQAINAAPKEIVFTSGATEADNLALCGMMARTEGALLTSRLEHSAVLATARALADSGRQVIYLDPTPSGQIQPQAVREALAGRSVGVVALMLVNNETGARTAIEEIAPIVHDAGALLFCDAVQAFGFESLDVGALGADAIALSGHKAYGPKGVGALWVRDGLDIAPVIHGGEQERGLRPGTLNTAAIVGMGAAAKLAIDGADEHGKLVAELRNEFENAVTQLDGVTVNASGGPRGPKQSSVSVSDVEGEALLMSLDGAGIYASAGSACSAGSISPSHVLRAMGLSDAEAKATIRFSFGGNLTAEQARAAAEGFVTAVERCRAVTV